MMLFFFLSAPPSGQVILSQLIIPFLLYVLSGVPSQSDFSDWVFLIPCSLFLDPHGRCSLLPVPPPDPCSFFAFDAGYDTLMFPPIQRICFQWNCDPPSPVPFQPNFPGIFPPPHFRGPLDNFSEWQRLSLRTSAASSVAPALSTASLPGRPIAFLIFLLRGLVFLSSRIPESPGLTYPRICELFGTSLRPIPS